MPTVVIVQGGPAVGKTTLATRLSTDLGLGLLAKDDVKELLFDKIGVPADREESRGYGQATMAALYVLCEGLAAAGKSFIMESAFHAGLAEQDFAAVKERHENVEFIQIYCHTSRAIQQQRYNERTLSGRRHPGHGDQLKAMPFDDYDIVYRPLDMPVTIDVDTGILNEDQYQSIVDQLRLKMGGVYA